MASHRQLKSSGHLTPRWVEGLTRGIRFCFGVACILVTYMVTSFRHLLVRHMARQRAG